MGNVQAIRQPPSFVQRRRLGRHPARKMQRMVVETSSSMLAIGGYVVAPAAQTLDPVTNTMVPVEGTGRCGIAVPVDEVPRVLAMLEKNTDAIETAKARCLDEMNDVLMRDYGIAPTALNSERAVKLRAEVLPHTWQRTFYEMNRRGVGPLCFAETVGQPYDGHPDGLDEDMEAVPETKLAKMISDGVTAGVAAAMKELLPVLQSRK